MVKETSLKKGLQTLQYWRAHETHHVISTSFSQKAIPILDGRTSAEERICTFQKKKDYKKPHLKSNRK